MKLLANLPSSFWAFIKSWGRGKAALVKLGPCLQLVPDSPSKANSQGLFPGVAAVHVLHLHISGHKIEQSETDLDFVAPCPAQSMSLRKLVRPAEVGADTLVTAD